MADAEPATAPLRGRLPRVAPSEAARRNAWLRLLSGLKADGAVVHAAILDAPDRRPQLRFGVGVSVAPDTVEGRAAAWLDGPASPVLPEALGELALLEPLIGALEARLGCVLEPERMTEGPTSGLALRLWTRDAEGRTRSAVRVAAPDGLAPPANLARVRRDALGAAVLARTSLRLVLDGPTAPAAELGELAAGDWIPVGGSGLRGVLLMDAKRGVRGRWSCASQDFTCEALMDETLDEAPGAPSTLPGGLPVQLRLELGAVEALLSDVAALAPGAVLPAALAGDSPRVEVTAGGARIAVGRLVAVGEAYGVLIDSVEGLGADRA